MCVWAYVVYICVLRYKTIETHMIDDRVETLSIAKCQVYSQDTRRHRACGRRNGHWSLVAGAKKYKYNTKYNTNAYNTKYTPPSGVFSFPGGGQRRLAVRLAALGRLALARRARRLIARRAVAAQKMTPSLGALSQHRK
jgi:hypothetical protein